MKKRSAIIAALTVASLVAFAGCERKETPRPAEESQITTTAPESAPTGTAPESSAPTTTTPAAQ